MHPEVGTWNEGNQRMPFLELESSLSATCHLQHHGLYRQACSQRPDCLGMGTGTYPQLWSNLCALACTPRSKIPSPHPHPPSLPPPQPQPPHNAETTGNVAAIRVWGRWTGGYLSGAVSGNNTPTGSLASRLKITLKGEISLLSLPLCGTVAAAATESK